MCGFGDKVRLQLAILINFAGHGSGALTTDTPRIFDPDKAEILAIMIISDLLRHRTGGQLLPHHAYDWSFETPKHRRKSTSSMLSQDSMYM